MQVSDDDVRQVVENIWSSLFGTPLQTRGPADMTDLYTGRVQLTGGFDGSVVLNISTSLARKAAAVMFNIAIENVSLDDARDATCELTNIAGGNLKALSSSHCDLGLPTVTRGVLPDDAEPLTDVWFESEGDPLRVSVRSGTDRR